jgi:uncharacterized protein (TIGR02757 family)
LAKKSSKEEKQDIQAYLRSQIPIWHSEEKFPVEADPLGVVRAFLPSEDKRVVEVAAFFSALFAWGRRDIAIAKTKELLRFVLEDESKPSTLKPVFDTPAGFKHRTFTSPMAQALLVRLQDLLVEFGSMENAFAHFAETRAGISGQPHSRVESALNGFRAWMLEPAWMLPVTRHISAPERGSACKRLNLMLRWLCRPDTNGLDCGVWKAFSPAELVMPLDVHVLRSARHFGLLHRATPDWKAAIELTEACREIVPNDPLVMDYVLFGLSQSGALDALLAKK